MIKELTLKDYIFGYADAEVEYTHKKEIFSHAFYDINNNLDKLINGHHFMLVGRKGVGKTAYSAKIREMASSESGICAATLLINQLEYRTFNKLADNKYVGTQKYEMIWKWSLCIQIIKFLINDLKITENEGLNTLVDILENNGIVLSDSLPMIVKRYAKIHAQLSVKNITFKYSSGDENITIDMFEFIEKMLAVLYTVGYNKKIILIIDGIDDILRFKKDKIEMISGLIRAANNLNLSFRQTNTNFKNIILIRNDILYLINDPDINKIKRDGSINLLWDQDSLKEMLDLRFKLLENKKNDIDYFSLIFPVRIKNNKAWDFIIDHTLLRPRDILQFLVQAQNMYPNKSKLSYAETLNVLKAYSTDYFIEEMKDELSGLIDDQCIQSLHPIFQKIGDRNFLYSDFKESVIKVEGKEKDDSYYREILLALMECSYVGQIVPVTTYNKNTKRHETKNQVHFKYKSPRLTLDLSNKFIIHRALHKSLNFSIK